MTDITYLPQTRTHVADEGEGATILIFPRRLRAVQDGLEGRDVDAVVVPWPGGDAA